MQTDVQKMIYYCNYFLLQQIESFQYFVTWQTVDFCVEWNNGELIKHNF